MERYKFSISKRLFDLIGSGILVLILSIPFLLLVLLLFISSRENPFFVQYRSLSLSHKKFRLYKLRTISGKASINLSSTKRRDIFSKAQLSSHVSPFASWLRRTGLDELPQLINVIKGEMSLVGPRPLMLEDLHILKETARHYYNFREAMDVLPGITGIWQVFCDRSKGASDLAALDILYQKEKSLILDFKILIFTAAVLVTANNADSIVSKNILTNRSVKKLSRVIRAKTISSDSIKEYIQRLTSEGKDVNGENFGDSHLKIILDRLDKTA